MLHEISVNISAKNVSKTNVSTKVSARVSANLRINILVFFLFSFLFSCAKNDVVNYNALKPNLPFNSTTNSLFSFTKPVPFSSPEGIKRLNRAFTNGFASDFYNTINFYAPQVYPVTCGPASLKIALSSLFAKEGIQAPISRETTLLKSKNGLQVPHFIFTERNLFDNVKEEDKNRGIDYDIIARQKPGPDGKFGGGISIQDLALVAKTFPQVQVEYFVFKSEDLSDEKYKQFKEKIIAILKDPNRLLIINYYLPVELPLISGHYTLVVAFDPKTESVLLLNTMAYYTTWNWISLKDIFLAMNTLVSGFDRGVMELSIKEEFRKNNKNNT